MIKWKDFLYFEKGNKLAIILLLILTAIAGGISVYLSHFLEVDPAYQVLEEKTQNEFVEFEESLADASVIDENAELEEKTTKPKPKKIATTKLELGQMIDLNVASVETLTRIPGIGNTFAERIIGYRNDLGGFYGVEQLQEVKGITTNKFSKILPFLSIKKKHRLIRINHNTSEQLAQHPYFTEHHIKAILTLRQGGKIKSIEELIENESFTTKEIEKIEPYLSFE